MEAIDTPVSELIEETSENQVVIEKPATKPKKPRSEKQIAQFEKAKVKRLENITLKREEDKKAALRRVIEEEGYIKPSLVTKAPKVPRAPCGRQKASKVVSEDRSSPPTSPPKLAHRTINFV